ncbi:MAG: hypothetical protein ABIG94_07640, partial [Pseudomonadota bacterium]
CDAARPGILPVGRQGSVKIDFILFLGKIRHLFKATAGKFGLTHCKKKGRPGRFPAGVPPRRRIAGTAPGISHLS